MYNISQSVVKFQKSPSIVYFNYFNTSLTVVYFNITMVEYLNDRLENIKPGFCSLTI